MHSAWQHQWLDKKNKFRQHENAGRSRVKLFHQWWRAKQNKKCRRSNFTPANRVIQVIFCWWLILLWSFGRRGVEALHKKIHGRKSGFRERCERSQCVWEIVSIKVNGWCGVGAPESESWRESSSEQACRLVCCGSFWVEPPLKSMKWNNLNLFTPYWILPSFLHLIEL